MHNCGPGLDSDGLLPVSAWVDVVQRIVTNMRVPIQAL